MKYDWYSCQCTAAKKFSNYLFFKFPFLSIVTYIFRNQTLIFIFIWDLHWRQKIPFVVVVAVRYCSPHTHFTYERRRKIFFFESETGSKNTFHVLLMSLVMCFVLKNAQFLFSPSLPCFVDVLFLSFANMKGKN